MDTINNARTTTKIKELQAIIGNLPDHIFLLSEDGYCVDLYEGKDIPLSLSPEHYIGKHISEAYSEDITHFFLTCIDEALNRNTTLFVTYSFEFREMKILPEEKKTTNKIWFEARIKTLPDHTEEGKRIVMWLARDITDKHRLEEEVRLLIETDELTGIYNRRSFLGRLSNEFDQYHRYFDNTTLLMIDIDDFKYWNDKLGHLAGDKVIRHVTNMCASELRECDYFGRLGGEEFAVLLPHTDEEQAKTLAERLCKIVKNTPCNTCSEKVTVTISIGLSQFRKPDKNHTEVLSRSDKAMYLSKKQGKNQVTIYS